MTIHPFQLPGLGHHPPETGSAPPDSSQSCFLPTEQKSCVVSSRESPALPPAPACTLQPWGKRFLPGSPGAGLVSFSKTLALFIHPLPGCLVARGDSCLLRAAVGELTSPA